MDVRPAQGGLTKASSGVGSTGPRLIIEPHIAFEII